MLRAAVRNHSIFVAFATASVLSIALVACGGSASAPPASARHGEGHEHGEHGHGEHGHEHGEHGEHAKLSPALKDFHEVLAPVWHSPAGAERVAKTCTASETLSAKATATGDAELIASTAETKKACAATGRPVEVVESAIMKVHQRFHAIAER